MSHPISIWRGLLPALALALLGPWAAVVQADTGHPAAQALAQRAARAQATALEDANEGRVIVQYRRGATLLAASPRRAQHAAAMGRRLSLPLTDGRALGERMQGLRGKGLSSSALAARLAVQADVEWAVVDGRKSTAAVPNDPFFGDNQTSVTPVVGQWYLRAADSTLVSATNAVAAWDITTGLASVTVAVLDTGVRFDHPDLAGKLHPGYDFVRSAIDSDSSSGADGDASDPGDAIGCSTSSKSSWHGTQVAGLVAAATDNGLGVAGIGRNVMVLPVRVLGQCGSGYDSDIIAGMRWAAGLSNDSSCTSASTPSATCNPNPAKVINMSLGGSGSCSSSYQTTLTELVNAGVAVVVAAGNDAGHAVNSPANCTGAIGVAGVRHAGTKVGYSNLGPQIALAAPAGNCVNVSTGSACLYPLMTTTNLGSTAPGSNGYSDSFTTSLGTSFASPLVAGTVALMRSLAPGMTPAQLKTALQGSARAFPSTGGTDSTVTSCRAPTATDQLECYCTTSTCGAGMLDTAAAVVQAQALVAAAAAPTAVITAGATTPTLGDSVALSAAASQANGVRTLVGWQWQISSGASLASFSGATNSASATLLTTGAGSVTVSLTVTDSAGATASSTQVITVQAAAAGGSGSSATTSSGSSGGSGGGGGALGAGWLAGLLLAVLALARGRAAGAAASGARG
ncbi:S8 family serine peptidase [Aquabacterium sp. OR-4]|uniref:S8 family serine peptidase n=1 Tax=Aquabacterium sp. OR-4 TaxID=2978127 RepID=UPI0021B2841E|nr:S8 family serine peptidase [Aquabacterium sp. OR-4]MDT7834076.1 S8 family serine peptidase [Aquabacterium sp. OR-4]